MRFQRRAIILPLFLCFCGLMKSVMFKYGRCLLRWNVIGQLVHIFVCIFATLAFFFNAKRRTLVYDCWSNFESQILFQLNIIFFESDFRLISHFLNLFF